MRKFIGSIPFSLKSRGSRPNLCPFLFLLILFIFKSNIYAEDSLALFDRSLSFQSRTSIAEQLAISYKAEDYAKRKGNVYKCYSYGVSRCYLYFLSDEIDSCKRYALHLRPLIETELEKAPADSSAEWKILLADCITQIGASLIYNGQLDTAFNLYKSLLDKFEPDDIPHIEARCLNGIGVVFAYRHLFDMAENYFEKALEACMEGVKREREGGKRIGNIERTEFLITTNLGALYFTQSRFDQALPYCTRAYQIARQSDYQGQDRISSSMAMGSLYMGMDMHGAAEPYLSEAIEVAERGHYSQILPYAEATHVRNLLALGRYEQAYAAARKALESVRGKKRYSLEADLLESLSYIYENTGRPEEALRCMRQLSRVRDSSLSLESQQELLDLEYKYNALKQEKEAQEKTKDLALAKTKAQNRTLWILVLVTCLAFLVVLLLLLAKHVSKLNRNNTLIKEESRKHILHAEQALEDKNKELATDALRFLRLNNLQASILDALKKLKSEFPMKGRQTLAIREIETLARQIASEKEWRDFQFYFEQVDKQFLKKLSERFPDLTPSEKHLCVLFNLSLSNKDVANLTGKSLQSIGMAKFRLRSKLGIDGNTDLAEFLSSL